MNTTRKSPIPKYRPSLTADNILKILSLAKSESPISPESIQVIATLDKLRFNIENDLAKAAYHTSPKTPLHESLGIARPPEIHASEQLSKEEYWETCYKKYTLSPVSCSVIEIDAAKEHMYLHDLLSDREVETLDELARLAMEEPKI